jgi:2-polyprenyl-3-methyl-5-hydroxy-6-metoxy-1,4-benzoquinol methylase
VVRLLTVWLTAVIGVAGCWRLWRRARPFLGERPTAEHFGGLAPRYAEELSAAARERVVRRKVELMRRRLRAAGIAPGARLLDAGCGHGWYAAALAGAGYAVTGIDLAPEQVAAARAQHPLPGASREQFTLAAASLFAPPFPAGLFDAAYAVNVLHHAGDRPDQDAALAALARVVRPGGLIFVHEINTVNPLFRLYMAYVFPLLKQIDVGTETWLDPRHPPRAAGLELQAIELYTFLPDFTPRRLYRRLDRLERLLERSRWSHYSAHFTAVYRRPSEAAEPVEVERERRAAGARGAPVSAGA